MSASFEERSVWVQLFGMVLAIGGYFVIAGRMMGQGVHVVAAFAPLFVVAVVLLVVIQVLGHVLATIGSRIDAKDERDRLIGWRSESNASWIVAVGVLGALSMMVLGINNVWVAHVLLGSLFLSEVAKYVFQLVYYRRGL